jgi:predicted DNA binding CopG/RHH family protein
MPTKNNNREVPYLDTEERKLVESLDEGGWRSVKDEFEPLLREAARTTLAKNRRINIRMTENDYRSIKYRAVDEGMPYQTLITSVLHRYLTGQLVPVSRVPHPETPGPVSLSA